VKLFFVQALVAAFAMLIVMAVVFRNRQAKGMLTKLRDGIVLYVILILILGLARYAQQTF
jgi:hypothetical protein